MLLVLFAHSPESDKFPKSILKKYRFISKHNSNCGINYENKIGVYTINVIIYFIIVLYSFIFIELAAVSMPLSYHSPKILVPTYKTSLKPNYLNFNLSHINSMFMLIIFKLISSYLYYDKQNILRRYLKRGLNSLGEFCSVSLVIYLYTMNIILVVCSNMTILNQGPACKRGLTVYYQNIQGLITFTHLNSENPPLNLTKLAELHTYVAFKKPDIVILNETWLKANIGSMEIFPFPKYKIFRLDRSPDTHPPDKIDKCKFENNGGGVLKAVNKSKDVNAFSRSFFPSTIPHKTNYMYIKIHTICKRTYVSIHYNTN